MTPLRPVRYLSLWRKLLVLCFRRQPGVAAGALLLRLAGMVTLPVAALALKGVVDASQAGALPAAVRWSVLAAAAYAIEFAATSVGFSLRMQAVERVGLTEVDPTLVREICAIEGLDHLEKPEYLDRITLLRGASWGLVDSAWGVLESVINIGRLGISVALLGTINPWLLMLVLFAAAPLWFDSRGRSAVRAADKATAEPLRLQRHLFDLATTAGPGKEIRVAGAGPYLAREQAAAWEAVVGERYRAQMAAAVWKTAGWTVFAAGFAAALGIVMWQASRGRGTPGDVMLAVTIACSMQSMVRAAVTRTADTAAAGRLIEPYLWLSDYAAAERDRPAGTQPAPDNLRDGIRLANLSYTYPGTETPAVDDVSVHLPSAAVVAIVGEYGSGKTTLAKLLCKFHRPQSGSIRVDGVDLRDLDTVSWWAAMSVVFQDFGRYLTTVREGIAIGEPAAMNDDDLVEAAAQAGDLAEMVSRLDQGLDTRLGRRFGGIDLSEGQWQRLALARACMRAEPRLFLLDEPTASLDAPSEKEIFARHIRRARDRAARNGAITVIVSHRFSTVADADLILVMRDGRLVESGTHQELLAAGGMYADLYSIARNAYAA